MRARGARGDVCDADMVRAGLFLSVRHPCSLCSKDDNAPLDFTVTFVSQRLRYKANLLSRMVMVTVSYRPQATNLMVKQRAERKREDVSICSAPIVIRSSPTTSTSVVGVAIRLFVSSAFNNPERAMAMAPMLIMPQLLFSGVVIELKGAMELISNFVNCRWGMSALGSIASLNGLMLKAEDKLGTLPEDKVAKLRLEIDATLFDRSGFNAFSAWAVVFVFCIVCVLGCMLVQWVRTRRKR